MRSLRRPVAGLLLAGLALGTTLAAEEPDKGVARALDGIQPQGLRAHMRFLADDALEGRRTGTRGYDLAAKYVAAQLEAIGLEPGGTDGTYFQNVPLRAYQPDGARSALSLLRDGRVEKLAFGVDFLTRGDAARSEVAVEAPVVYVGYGVTAPELGSDDFAGVDAAGKILALVGGAPPSFEPSLRAHYSSTQAKLANAVAHGAVGLLLLNDPVLESVYPWASRVRDLAFPSMAWRDSEGRPVDRFPELRGVAFLGTDAVAKLLAGSGATVADLYRDLAQGRPRAFALSVSARIETSTELDDVQSANVAGLWVGSDPALRDEVVVFTAHLDHMGIGPAVDGDTVYNGALDNASGVACLLELARAFTRLPERPRRSILFLAVTGEEEGLLGADYFARHPTLPGMDLVANVNMDEVLMLWPLEDLIVYGAEHSSLGAIAEAAARRLDLTLSPDPQPEQVFFVRSDQYAFVKQGIPALAGSIGFAAESPQLEPPKIAARWARTTYHQPQDDMTQAFHWSAGVQYARFHFLVGYWIAQQTERPRWNPGDFFGERYAGAPAP